MLTDCVDGAAAPADMTSSATVAVTAVAVCDGRRGRHRRHLYAAVAEQRAAPVLLPDVSAWHLKNPLVTQRGAGDAAVHRVQP